jgi:hypothetical protein
MAEESKKAPAHVFNYQIVIHGATLDEAQEAELRKQLASTLKEVLRSTGKSADGDLIPSHGRKIIP